MAKRKQKKFEYKIKNTQAKEEVIVEVVTYTTSSRNIDGFTPDDR